ncbi:RNA polymerase sigma factor, TIGR02999 family [Lysobacter sp. yr284]|nr:RNA polymerase sigma factor, TIGR02999 family [Lysobacter sp. yr284]
MSRPTTLDRTRNSAAAHAAAREAPLHGADDGAPDPREPTSAGPRPPAAAACPQAAPPPGAAHPDDPDAEALTELLAHAQGGAPQAWDRIYAAVYRELHMLARHQIRRHWAGPERSPTSLLSRTWLRLNQSGMAYKNRRHLIAILVRAMRFALIDEARRTFSTRRQRGEREPLVSYEPDPDAAYDSGIAELLAIHQGLDTLGEHEPRLAQVVEMRYFGGLSDAEIADALGVTTRTVHRDWVRARAFLSSALGAAAAGDG